LICKPEFENKYGRIGERDGSKVDGGGDGVANVNG
jgi:hypothetical protein